ncbi:hypothetical protein J4E80_006351 [Alternaria sp. BMP 0032]|nr:hypothetical protein J4E80_006351 [Alternaria sp. BMP 0032]
MRGIYSRAATVIVWTGSLTPDSKVFFAQFQDMREKLKDWMAQAVSDVKPVNPTKEELPHDEEAFWGGLGQLLKNEWFRRLWTYQEILLPSAAILLCGNSWVEFDEFLDFIMDGWFKSNYISSRSKIGRSACETTTLWACDDIKSLRERSTGNERTDSVIGSHDIAYNLDHLRLRHVKEQVDRVWAIVELLGNDLRDKLASEVDYSDQGRSEYWKTWISFAKALVDGPGGMELLQIPPALEPRPSNLPSWCPDLSGSSSCKMTIDGQWHYTIGELPTYISWALQEDVREEESLEKAAALLNHGKKFMGSVEEDNMLRIRGFLLDTVEEVVEHDEPLGIAYEFYDPDIETHLALYRTAVNRHLESLALARRVFYGRSEGVTDVPDDFIRALFLDCRTNQRAKDVYSDLLPRLPTWYSRDKEDDTWEQRQCQMLIETIRGHTFFSTKGGRIGFAHPGCKPGDQIATFYGGEPLYILRRLNPTNDDMGSAEQGYDDVQYMGAAFIPHLMEQDQRDTVRIGPDTTFMIH